MAEPKSNPSPAATAKSVSLGRVRVPVEQAARIVGRSESELRAAVIAGRLEGERDPDTGAVVLVVDLETAELPAPAAARLVGVSPITMRAWVRAGRVRGRREGRGWVVRVEDLLAAPGFPAELRSLVLGLDGGKRAPRRAPARPLSPATRVLYVRLGDDESAALAAAVERYGSQRAAVGAALRELSARSPLEAEITQLRRTVDETRRERETHKTTADELRGERARFPSALWCEGCRSFVPLGKLEADEDHEHGRVLVHRHKGASVLVQGARTLVAKR